MVEIKNYKHKSSRHIKVITTIYDENRVHIKSLAALIMLNEYLTELDTDVMEKKGTLDAYLDLRHEWLGQFKVLKCHYCGKEPLEIGERDIKKAYINNANAMLATIDHKVPVSAGCEHNDTSNWLVSCKNCNRKKGNMSYEDFTQMINENKLKVHRDKKLKELNPGDPIVAVWLKEHKFSRKVLKNKDWKGFKKHLESTVDVTYIRRFASLTGADKYITNKTKDFNHEKS